MSSELCAGAMAVQCQPFTCFHTVHGTNVRIDPSGTQATRVESFANGICFSREPLEPGQLFLVEIEEKEFGWCGHLRIGLMARDPRSLDVVPEYSLPDLINQGDSWIFAITRNHNRVLPDDEENSSRSGMGFLSDPYLKVGKFKIPRDKLFARSRPGRFSHILDDLYKTNVLPPTARRSRIGVLYEPQADGTRNMHIIINGEDMGASARGIPGTQPLYAVIDVFASTKSVRVIQLEYGCRYHIQQSAGGTLMVKLGGWLRQSYGPAEIPNIYHSTLILAYSNNTATDSTSLFHDQEKRRTQKILHLI